jgi:hypothetical protein
MNFLAATCLTKLTLLIANGGKKVSYQCNGITLKKIDWIIVKKDIVGKEYDNNWAGVGHVANNYPFTTMLYKGCVLHLRFFLYTPTFYFLSKIQLSRNLI